MSCPICGKAVEAKYRPFCSRRCADIDLGRWLNEGYRVKGEAEDDAAEGDSNGEGPEPRRPI